MARPQPCFFFNPSVARHLRGSSAFRGLVLVLAGLLAVLLISAASAQTSAPRAEPAASAATRPPPEGFAGLARRLMPAVVNISTRQTVVDRDALPIFPPDSPTERFNEFFGRNEDGLRMQTSLGSGFVIDASGIIVTNNHVIEEADEIEVLFADGLRLPATVIGRDPETDLAVLKVSHSSPLPTVAFGNSDTAEVGDWVLAIGNPFGLGASVSVGIVSARNRDISTGRYDDFIQTDAAINRGNSGGPLFNLKGEVIGVNTAIFSPTGASVGIGFSVPSNLARSVTSQLSRKGVVTRGRLGVNIQPVNQAIAESYGLRRPAGAIITMVEPGGPGAKAGLRVGDLITKFGGQNMRDARALSRAVADAPIGRPATLEYVRKGKIATTSITVAAQASALTGPTASGPVASTAPIRTDNPVGVKLVALNEDQRRRYRIPASVEGALVEAVDTRSDASGKVYPGDVVLEVQFETITSPGEASARMREAAPSNRPVLLRLWRQGNPAFVSVRPR
jgi:serine protease Do